jgi:MarR family transcriptional regulator, negative regulator of the multidrug operon emrRAB
MDGQQCLVQLNQSTPRMARALPDMPMTGTVMVRLLRIVGGGLTDFFEPEFRALDLSENGFHILCLLVASEDGTASPSTLSEMVGTSRANITRILEQLDKEGWIERRPVARDGRRKAIAISDSGRIKVAATVPQIVAPILRAFAGLSASEMATLAVLLRKLTVSLDQGASMESIAA